MNIDYIIKEDIFINDTDHAITDLTLISSENNTKLVQGSSESVFNENNIHCKFEGLNIIYDKDNLVYIISEYNWLYFYYVS